MMTPAVTSPILRHGRDSSFAPKRPHRARPLRWSLPRSASAV